jgi:hypothetical protein
MKRTIFLLLAATLFVHELQAGDTVKIEITRVNRIAEKDKQQQQVTVSQKFLTPDDTLIREVRYDEYTGELSGYTFYFYRGHRLSSEETYDAENKIDYIVTRTYDRKGNCTGTGKKYSGTSGNDSEENIVRSFDGSGKIIAEKVLHGKHTVITRKFEYDKNGNISSLRTKYGSAADTVIAGSLESYTYDAPAKLNKVLITGKTIDNQPFSYADTYSYNDDGRLISVNRTEYGKPLFTKTYSYYATGTLRNFILTDWSGKIVKSLVYEYSTNVMNIGIQKSLIDGLVYP